MTTSIAKSRSILMILALAATLAASGCSGNKPKSDESVPSADNAIDNSATGDSDSGKAMGLQTIHFPYDAFAIDAEAKGQMKNNAQIMKDHPSLKIQVEGHCDQRGGIQYNVALGEKRANATRKYLEDMGISGDRITTVSMGKEHLLDQGTTEEAYAKNRRANFVVTTK
jgi:peptidoglycan-associated lipoprotein